MIEIVSPWFMKNVASAFRTDGKSYAAISLFFVIVYRDKSLINPKRRNHEKIHQRQQLELLIIGFVILYFLFYLDNRLNGMDHNQAYEKNPFELEAYLHDDDLEYLRNRRPFAWRKHLAKSK